MKFKVKDLSFVLGKLRHFLAPQGVRPIFSCFLFDQDRLVAFNGESFLSHNFPVGFKAAVPGETFYRLIDSMEGDCDILLELKEKEGAWLEVKLVGEKGRSKLLGNIKLMDPEEFVLPDFKDDYSYKFKKKEGTVFMEALMLCFMSCKKGVGSIMNGVALTPQGIFSSDNFRVSWHKGFKAEFNELIPYDSLQRLSGVGYIPVRLFRSERGLLGLDFSEGATFITSLPSVEFPTDTVTPHFEGYGRDGFSLPSELKEAMERSDFFQADIPEASRMVSLKVMRGKVWAETFGSGGDLKEFIPCNLPFKGEFYIVPKFLASILGKSLTLFYKEEKPLRFVGGDFQHLISLKKE